MPPALGSAPVPRPTGALRRQRGCLFLGELPAQRRRADQGGDRQPPQRGTDQQCHAWLVPLSGMGETRSGSALGQQGTTGRRSAKYHECS